MTARIAELRTRAPASVSEFSYAHRDRDQLVLAGRLGPDSVVMQLRWLDDSKLVLRRWRTHVANNLPFSTTVEDGPYDGVPANPRDPASRKVDVARLIDLRGARHRHDILVTHTEYGIATLEVITDLSHNGHPTPPWPPTSTDD